MVILYGLETCSKCSGLKNMLNKNNVEYKYCNDVDIMNSIGISEIPTLQVNEKMLNLNGAIKWMKGSVR